MKLVISDLLEIDDQTHHDIEALGYTLTRCDHEDAYTGDAEVLVSMKMSKDTLPNGLKFAQLLSAGYDSINLELFKNNSVALANGRGMYSIPIAEYCVAHLLSRFKTISEYRTNQDNSKWDRVGKARSVDQSRILILGTGSIAQETAKRLKVFNATVDGVNSNGRSMAPFDSCFALSTLDSIISKYDAVICTLPHNEATYHIMDAPQFSLMKDDAVFINIGRGACVNLDGLMSVLDNHVGSVILDVFEEEPLDPNHPLWKHPKATITPHASFESNRVNEYRVAVVMENLRRYATGQELINRIL